MTNEFLTQGKRFFNHEGHEEHEAIIIFGSEVWMKVGKKYISEILEFCLAIFSDLRQYYFLA
jgi:hypothetical protein